MAEFKSIFDSHLRALAEQAWNDKVASGRYPFGALGPFPTHSKVTTDIEATVDGCDTCGQWAEVEINVDVDGITVASYANMAALFDALDQAAPTGLTCETCHKTAPDVRDREDPYRADVYNERVTMRLCDSCTAERVADI